MRTACLRTPGTLWADHTNATGQNPRRDTWRLRSVVPGDGWRPVRSMLARMEGVVHPSGGPDPGAGALSGGGQRPSWAGGTDDGAVGPYGRDRPALGPGFDRQIPPGGYVWWYVDALSDDGRYGLTIIAMLGNVFSPYYAWAGRSDPLDHCAINVALYGAAGHRWAMTERGRRSVRRTASHLAIGPSSVTWEGGALVVRIDETTFPLPSRLRGVVRVHPIIATSHVETLDGNARHHWWPVSPLARVEVDFELPSLSWSGMGYHDANAGEEPLEAGFVAWDWSRAQLEREGAVLYDIVRRDGSAQTLALRIKPDGSVEAIGPGARTPLDTTLWRVRRRTLSEDRKAEVSRTLEDTPFYARSVVRTRLLGQTVTTMHESLDLDRFRAHWVRLLLPFRMPRRR
jgi:carotenoid 1,2-hydratase